VQLRGPSYALIKGKDTLVATTKID
jgi:hypothetical protein